MRKARFRIYRLSPPFTRTVEVRRITVAGFLELVRQVAPKVAGKMVAAGRALSETEFIHSAADAATLAAAADLVCIEQPVGFLRGWLDGRLGGAFAYRNTSAFLAACRDVEGEGQWTRFLGCLAKGEPGKAGKSSGRRGGLMADVITLSGIFHLPPAAILDTPLKDFLDLCDAINGAAAAAEDEKPEASGPVPIADLEALGSGKVFH